MKPKMSDETVLNAALQVFARYGYRKATLEDIAGEMNVTAAAMYAYAASKRALYEKTVRYAMLRWQSRARAETDAKETAVEKLTALCASALHYLAEDKEFSALLRNDPSLFPMFPTVDPYEEINVASVELIQNILELGVKTGEFRALDSAAVSNLMFALYKSFIMHAYVQGETDFIEENLPQALDLILRGVLRQSSFGTSETDHR